MRTSNQSLAIVLFGLMALSFGLSGCKPQRQDVVLQSKSKSSQSPDIMSSVPSQLRPGATFVTYSNGDKAQIEGGKEVVRSRKPTEGEVTLQFWRHKFPKAAQYYEPVHGSGTADGHQQPLYQLKIPSQGVTVIYHSQIDRVQEVIEYAPL